MINSEEQSHPTYVRSAQSVQETIIQRNNDLDLAYLEAQKLVFVDPATITAIDTAPL
jgi:hypothetical protein